MKTKRDIHVHPRHQAKYIEALRLREEQSLTGIAIAQRLGLNSRTVNYWLQGRRAEGTVKVLAHHVITYQKALRLRLKRRLSAEKIARRLGLYPRTVGYWLQKERERNTNVERSE